MGRANQTSRIDELFHPNEIMETNARITTGASQTSRPDKLSSRESRENITIFDWYTSVWQHTAKALSTVPINIFNLSINFWREIATFRTTNPSDNGRIREGGEKSTSLEDYIPLWQRSMVRGKITYRKDEQVSRSGFFLTTGRDLGKLADLSSSIRGQALGKMGLPFKLNANTSRTSRVDELFEMELEKLSREDNDIAAPYEFVLEQLLSPSLYLTETKHEFIKRLDGILNEVKARFPEASIGMNNLFHAMIILLKLNDGQHRLLIQADWNYRMDNGIAVGASGTRKVPGPVYHRIPPAALLPMASGKLFMTPNWRIPSPFHAARPMQSAMMRTHGFMI